MNTAFFRLRNLKLRCACLPALVAATTAWAGPAADGEAELVDCVDPMIGAITLEGYGGHGLGKTFPGAASPFGMVQLSPDTITGGDNGSGYSYHHETIEGFSFLHLSGVGWYGDLGNFQVMPAECASRFRHSHEVARAGYYAVLLDDCRVRAELTAFRDLGFIRFTYPENPAAELKIDLARRIGELRRAKLFSRQELRFDSEREFHGSIVCDHRDGGWGRGQGGVDYTLHFRGAISRPLSARALTGGNSNLVLHARFPTRQGEQVTLALRVAFDGPVTRSPLADDDGTAMDFDRCRRLARAAWQREVFGGMRVRGGTPRQRRIFATALYHASLDPREVNAPLPRGFRQQRTVFSGWDVFRSQMPLLSLTNLRIVEETVVSMMNVMESGKRDTLPVWDLFGCPSNCMVGNPLFPVMLQLQDAGGAFDERKALAMMLETTRRRGNGEAGYADGSLSDSLEYCYDDWCVARFAERLGEQAVARRFYARSRGYTNLWCEAVGSLRARRADGTWLEWHGATNHCHQGTVESNPLQQGWFVPHDVYGLIRLMGGRDQFGDRLNDFFERAPDDFLWGDYYNHPNEPSHHIAYLFAYCARPWLTQKWTRRILDLAYGDDVRGLCGNDDVGQMSAWYVLSAIGLHPVAPGSGIWLLTSPLFEEFSLPCANGPGRLTIRARGASDPRNVYLQSARLNGRELQRAWITTAELTAPEGLLLEYELGPQPNPGLFTELPPDLMPDGRSEGTGLSP
ncbi:MAG: GH92 family glycosyl hydrolase [Kiritimatiellia bacterium]